MADKKITELAALTSLAGADLFAVVDDVAGTPTTKKTSVADVTEFVANSDVMAGVIAAAIPAVDFASDQSVLANSVFG